MPNEDFCGGIDNVQCPDGYYCDYDGDYPDAGGTCVPDTTDEDDATGQFCGGFDGITCPEGYYCDYDGDYPDAGGTCQPY